MTPTRAAPGLAAFVLHSYDWSESSLVVELFSRSQGRLVVVAKGAKRPTSNFRPLLLPFHPLTVWLSRGAAADDGGGEVRSLRAVEWGGGEPLPAAALMSGFYLNELLLKGLARQDPHPALFDAYAQTLAVLAAPPVAGGAAAPAGEIEAVALRAFELVLLRELGWLPDLACETASAAPLAAERRYTLRTEAGLVPDSTGLSGAAWLALNAALEALRRQGSLAPLRRACAAEAQPLRAMLRHLVHYHLGTSQLRTRRVGVQLQRLASHPAAPSIATMNPLVAPEGAQGSAAGHRRAGAALSVNVNKVALLRNTRHLGIPSVVRAATLALEAGADGITVHPRPDERHIRAHDVHDLAALMKAWPAAEYNIEGNPFHNLMDFVRAVRPHQATFVPDSEGQFTSDHGWNLAADGDRVRPLIDECRALGVRVSLFMDADPAAMALARAVGADRVELYTEPYAAAHGTPQQAHELERFAAAARAAAVAGLGVNAGHDLNRANLGDFLRAVPGVLEVSIGHALVADALESGLAETVREYQRVIRRAAAPA